MIWFPRQKVVLYTPPKCASTYLHRYCCIPTVGGIHVEGPSFNGIIDKHTCHLPYNVTQWCDDCVKAVVVRDPVDRAVSLYKHTHRYHSPEHRPKDMSQFVDRWLMSGLMPFAAPICRVLNGAPWDRVVKVETLHQDLATLGIVFPERQREHCGPNVPTGDWDKTSIDPWAREDRRLFGY